MAKSLPPKKTSQMLALGAPCCLILKLWIWLDLEASGAADPDQALPQWSVEVQGRVL